MSTAHGPTASNTGLLHGGSIAYATDRPYSGIVIVPVVVLRAATAFSILWVWVTWFSCCIAAPRAPVLVAVRNRVGDRHMCASVGGPGCARAACT